MFTHVYCAFRTSTCKQASSYSVMFAADASGFGVWSRLYSGTDTFYEDRGLFLYTTYAYRLSVFNSFGQTTSNMSEEVTTYGAAPKMAANVTAVNVNHTAIEVNWTTPGKPQHISVNVSCTSSYEIVFCVPHTYM